MFRADAFFEQVFKDCIRGREDLHDYQEEAVQWLRERPFSALFIDVGMGKTVITETLLDELFCEGYQHKVLIIAPIRVANRVWMREHRLWRHLAYFDPEILRVEDDDPRLADVKRDRLAFKMRKWTLRNQAFRSPKQIHVINQEAVPELVEFCFRNSKKWPYPVVIYDESSRLRDHKAEGVKALRKALPGIIRFHQLTATPASQTYMHLFSQIYLLDGGKRLGTNITPFRDRYFVQNRWTREYTIRPGGAEEIEEKIADICLVMQKEKNNMIRTRPIHLPPKIMEQYREFEVDSVLELPDDVIIDAANGAVLSNKLLQFASGAVYDNDKNVHLIHDEKIEELKQLSNETLDNPILVAYWYKSSLDRLRKAFPKAAIMDKEGKAEESWNKRKHKLMFVHPRGSAHGLNLQFGGHHLALYDIFWPLELFTQLVGRLDRQGQTDTVMVHLLSAKGTMDETVSAKLEMLQNAEQAMFNRLRRLREKLKQRKRDDAIREFYQSEEL